MAQQTAVDWLINIFKIKSPCCKKPMEDIGVHKFWGGSESIIYECKKCKRQWI